MFGGDDLDEFDTMSIQESLAGDRRSTLSARRESARSLPDSSCGHSIADGGSSSRASIVSGISQLEYEHGWSGGARALANARTEKETRENKAAPPVTGRDWTFRPPAQRGMYRPVFAPSAELQLHEEDVDEVPDSVALPVLGGSVPSREPAGGADLRRGKSLKDRVMAALKPRTPEAERDDPLQQHPTGLVHRISRRIGRPKAREAERTYDPDELTLGHFSSRLAEYSDVDVQRLPPEIASIPLYAPPPSANVAADAPALSSYAPRAPLRPRSQTLDSDLPKPAQTVGQAARAFSIKRAQTLAARSGATTAAEAHPRPTAPPRYKSEDRDSRRASRRPKAVPEGWVTAHEIRERDERDAKTES